MTISPRRKSTHTAVVQRQHGECCSILVLLGFGKLIHYSAVLTLDRFQASLSRKRQLESRECDASWQSIINNTKRPVVGSSLVFARILWLCRIHVDFVLSRFYHLPVY
jgi:hypothetical protein